MRPGDVLLAKTISDKLAEFNSVHLLPGIRTKANRECLSEQIVDSIRRIKYVEVIKYKNFSPLRTDPSSAIFDPLKAAVWHKQHGNINEAYWLVFLSVNFGKNKKTGWRLIQGIYGGLGNSTVWDWNTTSTNLNSFRQWLHENRNALRNTGSFGNHRKYETLNAFGRNGTGETIASYIDWVGPKHDHQVIISDLQRRIGNDPRDLFRSLYKSMRTVTRFGRTAKFDYLTMIGKLGLADIEPDSTYMQGATGPLRGSRLLFGGDKDSKISREELEAWLIDLESELNLRFGMQVLEDAICNWQKSPSLYKYFSG